MDKITVWIRSLNRDVEDEKVLVEKLNGSGEECSRVENFYLPPFGTDQCEALRKAFNGV